MKLLDEIKFLKMVQILLAKGYGLLKSKRLWMVCVITKSI